MSGHRCPDCGGDDRLHEEIAAALRAGALSGGERTRLAAEARRASGGIEMKRGRGVLVAIVATAAVLLIVATRYVLETPTAAPAPPREVPGTARAPAPVPPAPDPAERAPALPALPPPPAPPAVAPPAAPAAGGEVSGLVTDTVGRPVAGARVELVAPGGAGGRELRTEADGTFRFADLPPGDWRLTVTADRHAPRDLAPFTVTAESGRAGLAIVLLSEERGETGAVWGSVAGRDGAPVAGARVQMAPGDGPESRLWMTTTDAEGIYRIAALPPGRYRIEVESPPPSDGGPPAPARQRYVEVGAGDPVRVDFVDVRTLRGVVLDAAGEPMADVIVRLSPLDEKGHARGGQYSPIEVRTGPDGRFTIPNAEDGPHRVDVQSVSKDDPFAVRLPDVDLAAGDAEVTLTIPETGISGRVVLADTGEPPSERPQISLYTIEPWNYTAMAFMDGTGAYRFRGVPPGKYRIYVHLAGHRTAQADVTLSAGEARTGVDFAMVKPATGIVVVKVRDEAGAPVEGADFGWESEPGIWTNLFVSTPEPGAYRMRMEAGRQKVSVHRAGLADATLEVDVPADGTTTVEVTLPPAPPK